MAQFEKPVLENLVGTDLGSYDQSSLVIDAAGLAKDLQVSLRHVNAMNATGRLPTPIRLGRSVRWSREELVQWIAAGAPSRDAWEAMKGARHD